MRKSNLVAVYMYEKEMLLFICSVMSDILGTLWAVAHQAPLSMGFSREEYWSGLPFLLQGSSQPQRSNLCLLHWQVRSLPLSHQEEIVPSTSNLV